jgi:hypothetical protein
MVTTIHLNKMKIQTDLSLNEHQKEFMKDLSFLQIKKTINLKTLMSKTKTTIKILRVKSNKRITI